MRGEIANTLVTIPLTPIHRLTAKWMPSRRPLPIALIDFRGATIAQSATSLGTEHCVSREQNRLQLRDDPRWRRLHDRSWVCSRCRTIHEGVFDIAYDRPALWSGDDEASPNSAVATSRSILSEDFCVIKDEHYFVRCVLEIPILGVDDERFGFGVWSTLSRQNFIVYMDTFDSGDQGKLGPWFGWFSNRLRGYPDTANLTCQVHPRDGRQRPSIELEPTGHPLAIEQRNGITFDRLLDIYAAHDHDLRPVLADA